MKRKELSNMLLDAFGKIDDSYIISAKNRLDGITTGSSPGNLREVFTAATHKAALAAAIFVLLLVSSFTVAMAANEEFRNAVFRFFKISTPDNVLSPEEEPSQTDALEDVENIGSTSLEGIVNVEYFRMDGAFDCCDGIIYSYEPWEGYDEDYDAFTRYAHYAYTVENGELMALEPHYENITYIWDGESYSIDFDWYEKDGAVYTNAKNYDPFSSVQWEVSVAENNPDYVILTMGFGQQIEYTQRPLLYNLRTKELSDILSACDIPEESKVIETMFSPDLSKLLITCDGGSIVYYYDITENVLKPLDELCNMEEPSAWFLDDEALVCISVDEDGMYTCGTLRMPSEEYTEIFSSMPRFGTSSESGIVLTGGRYGLLINSDGATHVYDFMTGERAIIEDFQYPVENAFTTMNSAGNKLLFVRFDPEADGLGVSEMGVLNLETYSFIVFDREGYEVRHEDTISWFDNDRVAISASTEKQGYLYLISVAF